MTRGTHISSLLAKLPSGRFAGLFLLLCLLVLRVADPPLVASIRYAVFDFYQQLKPREISRMPVSIVDVNDPSLQEIGQWPWPRSQMAELVAKITEAGAVAIAFDIIFSETDRLSPDKIARQLPELQQDVRDRLDELPDYDAIFAAAIASSRVILGQTSVRTGTADATEVAGTKDVSHAVIGGDPVPFLQKFPELLQNLPVLEEVAAGRGIFSIRPDPDGIYRRVPIVMLVQGKIRLGLAPELLRVATGQDAFAVKVNEAGIEGVVLARQLVPTGHDGSVWPYFSTSSPERYVSAADILKDRMPHGRLAGHLVLVGTSAIGLEDFRPTPLGIPMPGVEIHAQVLENILSKSFLVRPNYAIAVELTVAFVVSMLIVTLARRSGALSLIVLTMSLVVVCAGGSYYLFHTRRILFDPVWPVLCVVLSVMLMSSINYLREERMRRHIRSAFGQYVSPDLVARLADNRDALKLGGERRDLTVLFSDVRGFTTLAEGFRDDPAGLTALINGFLTVLSRAVLDNHGTIDKFMGDAVMAFWNAPLEAPDHEHAACHAALKMIADINAFNQERQQASQKGGRAFLPVEIGIGINTGECVVGNMGSDMRFDYTALGDAVNLSSRLEGQSKLYGTRIILGENTARKVAADFALIELDMIRVKGKTLPERIYGLLGGAEMRRSESFGALKQCNDQMRVSYNAQDWQGALDALARLGSLAEDTSVDLSMYMALYRQRIADFIALPPGADWDGIYTAESK